VTKIDKFRLCESQINLPLLSAYFVRKEVSVSVASKCFDVQAAVSDFAAYPIAVC